MILDGKMVAKVITDKIKEDIKDNNYTPELHVILVGENFASEKYVKYKEKKALEIGIKTIIHRYSKDITETELLKKIEILNKDISVNGLFVQLPLPEHIKVEKVINSISPEKDVDGFHPLNLGKLMIKSGGIKSCTPYGIMKLLQYYDISLKGKNVTIIGTSNIVGKPLSNMFMNEESTVTNCNSETKDLKSHTIGADIIISAAGVINLVTEDMVKDGVIIVDVGINQNTEGKLVGDVDYNNLKNKCSYITPVPGGVGPLTISILMSNTLDCFKNKYI
jgi:methylenetetrahydrofolate dehydrogenase (NADP+)/methenyltetrahydrofolate cyclohydrolase